MMRITREEEQYIGRARPSFIGRMKVGFGKDGRITALDMYVLVDNGPYNQQGDARSSGNIVSLLYQPPAMRWRGISVLTNTPPRTSQSSPGGMQGITVMETIMSKAARKLNLDQVAIRRINCPEGKAQFGPEVAVLAAHCTSAFIKEALDRGAEQFKWNERIAQPKVNGRRFAALAYRSVLCRRIDWLRRFLRDKAGRHGLLPVGHWKPGNGIGSSTFTALRLR